MASRKNSNNGAGGEANALLAKETSPIGQLGGPAPSLYSPPSSPIMHHHDMRDVGYGYIIGIIAISLIGALAITLVGAVRCLRATRRASGALALPIPLLPEDRTPLNAEPEHPVPMLSVQSPGCAGMERLGVPTCTSLGSPPHDRNHVSRRMRVDPRRDILGRDANLLSDRQVRTNHHHNTNYHYQHHLHQTINNSTSSDDRSINNANVSNSRNHSSSSSNSSNNSSNDFIVASTAVPTATSVTSTAGATNGSGSDGGNSGGSGNNANSNSRIANNNCRGIEHANVIRCPHHVPLPDSEWGQDRGLQIRTLYQQTEITRSYIKAPPNRSVSDVPEKSNSLFSSSSVSPSSYGMAPLSCNLGPHHNQHQHHHSNSQNHHNQQQQQKSKPNPIKNFFMKMSSPKSPSSSSSTPSPSLSTSSSSSSTSSSSSSIAPPPPSTIVVPGAAVAASSCSLGSSLGSLTAGTTTVIVPTTTSNNHHHYHFHQTQQQQQQQQQSQPQQQHGLVGSTNHHHNLAVVGSSCTTSLGVSLSASSSTISTTLALATQSIDCCYTQATSVRPRTPIVGQSLSAPSTSSLLSSGGVSSLQHQQQTTIQTSNAVNLSDSNNSHRERDSSNI